MNVPPAAVAAEVSSCDNSLSYSSLLLTTIFILFLTLQVLSASAFVITVHVMILMLSRTIRYFAFDIVF